MIKKIYLLFLLLLCVVNIVLGVYIEVIPDMYIYILGMILLLLVAVVCFFMNRRNKILFAIGVLLSIFMLVGNCLCSFVLIKANSFFDSITSNYIEVNNYSVIVLDDSSYEIISDIDGMEIGIINGNDNYNDAVIELKNIVNIDTKLYDNVFDMVNGLLNKKIDVIFLSESYISIINDGILYFSDSIRVLDTISIKEEKEVLVQDKGDVLDGSFNVYISGIDTYGEISTVSRSDVNIIASVNPSKSKILLTTVPRDMYVSLDGTSDLKDKLTHAGVYGIDMSIRTLENFLDTEIDYYIRVNFNSLINLVDYIGGIDVYSDYAFEAGGRYFKVGMNYDLTGKEALAFSRNRYAFSDGDRQRGRNQQKVIAAIISNVTSSSDINTYLKLLSTLENSFQTNMSKTDINRLIDMQTKNNYSWNIESISVNGYDHSDYTYSYPWEKLYVMLVDENSLNEAKNKIKDTLE